MPAEPLLLIGAGLLFDRAVLQWPAAQPARAVSTKPLEADDIADFSERELAAHPPGTVRVFAAIDSTALNFARMDLYAKLRLLGYRADTFVHPQARLDASVSIGENSYICEGALIGAGARIGRNCFVGPCARIGVGTEVGASCWIGDEAVCADRSSIGAHSIVGDRSHVASGVRVGTCCDIQSPLIQRDDIPDRTFLHPLFSRAVRIHSG